MENNQLAEISLASIKNKLVPPLENGMVGYMEFNIHDFEMLDGFEDNAEWFYEQRFKTLFVNESARVVAESALMGYGLDRKLANRLTEKECEFIAIKLWRPLQIRENVLLGYGQPAGFDREGFRFLKVMLLSDAR